MDSTGTRDCHAFRPVADWENVPEGMVHRDVPGVAVGHEDEVYVFARGDNAVIVYDRAGNFLRSWGADVFDNPHGIRVDSEGFVWCIDNGDHTVRKFSPTAEIVLTLGSPGRPSDTGVRARGGDYSSSNYRDITQSAGPFNGPTDVAVLRDGTAFVSDGYGNARVHRFAADGSLELSWGTPGSGPGQFAVPHAIVLNPDEHRVLVADRENNRIQEFDLEGELLDVWDGWCRPDGLAFSPDDGLLLVAELGLHAGRWPHMAPRRDDDQVSQCVLADHRTRTIIDRWGTDDPTRPGSFFAAHGVAVDSAGALYVGEVAWSGGGKQGIAPEGCHSLQKFVRRGTP